MQSPRVYVIGGRGTMGRRILSQLGDIPALGAGRRGPVVADVTAPEPFLEQLGPGDVIIDAVGPYLHDPTPLVLGCLSQGAHYLNLSESPAFQRAVRAALRGWEGELRSAVVIGCSTIPAMADGLMGLIERPGERPARRSVWLSMGTRNPVSAALLYSLLRPLGQKHARGRWWRELRERRLGDGRRRMYGSYPAAWSRKEFWSGFDRRLYARLLWFISFFTPWLPDRALWWSCVLGRPLAAVARFVGTRRGSLRLEVHDARGGVRALEVRAERDGLTIPAMPAAWAARALLSREDPPVGEVALTALVSGKEMARHLQAAGHVVQVLER